MGVDFKTRKPLKLRRSELLKDAQQRVSIHALIPHHIVSQLLELIEKEISAPIIEMQALGLTPLIRLLANHYCELRRDINLNTRASIVIQAQILINICTALKEMHEVDKHNE